MARSPMLSVRVDADVLAWVQAYADARGASRSAVVNAALREFQRLARSGVPELPARDGRSAARPGKVPDSGGPSSPGSASPAVPRPAAGDAPELVALENAVLRLEHERFGRPGGVQQTEMVRVRRRIRTGLVVVAGEVVRDPAALVDPSEVSV